MHTVLRDGSEASIRLVVERVCISGELLLNGSSSVRQRQVLVPDVLLGVAEGMIVQRILLVKLLCWHQKQFVEIWTEQSVLSSRAEECYMLY